MVKQYRGKHRYSDFQKDAAKLAGQGWHVVASTDVHQNIGCMRWLTLGLLSLIFRPNDILTVTYEQAAAPAPPVIIQQSTPAVRTGTPPPPPMPAAPPKAIRSAQEMRQAIAEFQSMRDAGDITPEEFDAARADILAGRR
jgi:hypothetical protein